jgi:hypothetical protein
MQIFTREEMTPSKKTIELIKKIAYSFNVENQQAFCLN